MQALIGSINHKIHMGALWLVLLTCAACGDSPTGPSEGAIALPGNSALVFEGATQTSDQQPRIEQLVRDAVIEAQKVLPLERVTIIVRYGSGVIPQLGFGGRANAGTVTMTIDPDSPAWPASLDT